MKPLTDEQFSDELLRVPVSPSHAEQRELIALHSALESYRCEALHWAERRSAAQPSLAAAARRSERWAALPRWSLATIAIVTIAAGVAHLSEQRSTITDAVANSPSSLQQGMHSSADEIAADNKLLNSIDVELRYHASSPVDAFDLKRQGMRTARASSIKPDMEE